MEICCNSHYGQQHPPGTPVTANVRHVCQDTRSSGIQLQTAFALVLLVPATAAKVCLLHPALFADGCCQAKPHSADYNAPQWYHATMRSNQSPTQCITARVSQHSCCCARPYHNMVHPIANRIFGCAEAEAEHDQLAMYATSYAKI